MSIIVAGGVNLISANAQVLEDRSMLDGSEIQASRFISPEQLDGYFLLLSSRFAMNTRERDPFDKMQVRLLARKLPKAAVQQAEAYIDALPTARQPKNRAAAIDDFLRWYFRGFLDTRSTISGGEEEDRQGFKAGQAYRRSNPEKLTELMKGFGYKAVEFDGVWSVSFEDSGFVPQNRPKETWWLSYMEGTESNLTKNVENPKVGVSIRITGFLSPDNEFGYGHLNRYKREFFATKISKINDG